MYPHHVFDLEPAGTFGMYPICYRQVSGRYFQPEPAMYSRCFCWFPGLLTPSVKRRMSSEWQLILSWVASHFLEKMTLFFSIEQLAIRNKMISDETNCLLYRVSRFSIPSWLTCWVHERPAALSNTFQRAEDFEYTVGNGVQSGPEYVWNMSGLG